MFFRKKKEKEAAPGRDSFDEGDETPQGRALDDPTIARSVTRPGASRALPSAPLPERVPEDVGEDVTQFIGAPLAYGSTVVAWLVHAAGPHRGRDVRLGAGITRVGSARDADIQLSGDSYASSKHAEITIDRGGAQLRDLGSTNGTFVNGDRVQNASLVDGDRVRFGTAELVFKCVQL